MLKKLLTAVCLIIALSATTVLDTVADNSLIQVIPDTWVAVDDLGRTVENGIEIQKMNTGGRYVGMFFWNWHEHFASKGLPARNVTDILMNNPGIENDYSAPAWTNAEDYFFWNEPVYGYYRSNDKYVIRKQAELLADAGVDFIVFDNTNGDMLFDKAYKAIFEVFAEAKEDGVNVPKIVFMFNLFSPETTVRQLKGIFASLYYKDLYKDLWFMYEGKPLILADKSGLNLNDNREKRISEFFTFKRIDPSYIQEYNNDGETWGWLSVYPQTEWGVTADGRPEEMTVSVAQNATYSGILTAMNGDNVRGRTFTQSSGKNSDNEEDVLLGANFQEQWDRVIEKDPEFVFVTGWNEWVAGRHEQWQGVMNGFPDEFNDEFSRDIEPSNGKLKDYYYLQLCENIRKYKGISAADTEAYKTIEKTIDISGDVSQWDEIRSFYHYTNSTYERNTKGYPGSKYLNDAVRNDVVKAKVAYDDTKIYFYVETAEDLTSHTDNAWMRLFIDTDEKNNGGNWEGFEYVINRENSTADTVYIEKANADNAWSWEVSGSASYTVNGKVLQIAVPRESLGFGSGEPSFNFKWSDNMQNDGDVMDFYKYGEAAPGSRFMFAFNRKAQSGFNILYVIIPAVTAVTVAAIVIVLITVIKKRKRKTV